MILDIDNDNEIITSAFKEDKKDVFSLHITTKDRWKMYDGTFSCSSGLTFMFDNADVSLIAQNDHDREILDRNIFVKHSKNELWILMPRYEIL